MSSFLSLQEQIIRVSRHRCGRSIIPGNSNIPGAIRRTRARATTHYRLGPAVLVHLPQVSLFTTSQSSPGPEKKMAAQNSENFERTLKRNPHPDFKQVEASRPPWDTSSHFRYTQTVKPSWAFGEGANGADPAAAAKDKKHVAIDPFAPDRPAHLNYKLLISAVVPRPIAFVSTASADGSVTNLAPFSYFQMVNHDPPLFVIGFASALAAAQAKDTLRLLVETGEAVINVVSEGFIEAANATSTAAPLGASEWDISGLTPARDCKTVRPARVAEAVFSFEVKLESVREFESRARPGKTSGTMAVLEGTHFWVREDAINEERSLIDPEVLRPISRLGGISYGRVTEAIEIPRPDFQKDVGGLEAVEKLKHKKH